MPTLFFFSHAGRGALPTSLILLRFVVVLHARTFFWPLKVLEKLHRRNFRPWLDFDFLLLLLREYTIPKKREREVVLSRMA